MDLLIHTPSLPITGNVNLPGSKSISNRILIIKALSGLNFSISNLSDSDDTRYLQDALKGFKNSSVINVGHAGTDMRFLTAFLAMQSGSFELTGSERLQSRPIKDLVEVLIKLGANISYTNKDGFPPLLIQGSALDGGTVSINGNISSQFITALLLVAPYFINGLELTIENDLVSKPYIQMTIELMKEFGADINWVNNQIIVKPGSYTYSRKEYFVESDWSSASYYYSLVALSPIGTELCIHRLCQDSLQADSVCHVIYQSFGVTTHFIGDVVVLKKTDSPIISLLKFDFLNCPDIAQTVMCTSVGLKIPFVFSGLQTLKLKETNRIIALQHELKKMNIDISINENSMQYLVNESDSMSNQQMISTYDDHRMAMSFATLSVLFPMMIENADVVSKSYPLFWSDMKQIGIHQTIL